MDWIPQPWDAIAVIVAAAAIGYGLERMFVAWMMRLLPARAAEPAAEAEEASDAR
jgi:hypothetical protein